MKHRNLLALALATLALTGLYTSWAYAADHNDPNSINAIFSTKDASGFHKTKESAADIYDIFGWPADDNRGDDERVILALTFAAIPKAGELDPDLMYRISMYPSIPARKQGAVAGFAEYLKATGEKFNTLKPAEVRASRDKDGNAKLSFLGFPGAANFTRIVPTNQNTEIQTPDGQTIKVFVGGRDDAFFNDLPGFFRSINYAPQFYHVSVNDQVPMRELPIPKTLLELEGNDLFNYDPNRPLLGLTGDPAARGDDIKKDLPLAGREFKPTRFKKENGKYRLVYTGHDAQAGKNVNAVILEIPLKFITKSPKTDRLVNVYSESLVIKAEAKANREQASHKNFFDSLWATIQSPFTKNPSRAVADDVENLDNYKLVDTDGQAFADAALTERWDVPRQPGPNNFLLGPHLALRLAHLGWGFGPSIIALGLPTSFDFPLEKRWKCNGQSDLKCLTAHYPVSLLVEYTDRNTSEGKAFVELPNGKKRPALVDAPERVKRTLFQELRMPDDSWAKNLPACGSAAAKGKKDCISLRRAFEIFVPNVNSIDMDTNGTWPFGRRPEDQVATRFLALFLDMNGKVGNDRINLETLNQPELWHNAPILPNPDGKPVDGPNPQKNDVPFLTKFPYLAEPHIEPGYYYR